MEYRENEQLKLASEFVQYTNKNIFITGKAGTGKTTFLHNLRKITPKRMVVVAPTGVAAINAGGVTIHSFFQLSFAPAIPESMRTKKSEPSTEGYQHKFSRAKIRLIKCIDLLVIDEISMVRADILDSVDEVLRKYRNRTKPFGGVQLLMIGDLHQLTPVIKDDEWNILKDYYPSVYFFDSLALKKSEPVSIELKEIFRQSDVYFIQLLNKVRDNNMDAHTIAEINTRHIPGFKPKDDEGYITLTTHNANAHEINQAKLKEINTDSHFFEAVITGDFSPYDFPTDSNLELKTGAQVMFIKNDPSPERKFYNGKIGKIARIEDEAVFVKCPGEFAEIEVNRLEWEHIKYSLNDATKEIDEDIVGSFTQIPLKLAWAITIHKSQGLTFDKVIIDANAAFAFGQVYVALSRCRTFDGIVLSTPISLAGIKTDSLVSSYSEETRQNEPGPDKLVEAKKIFQLDLIFELFDFHLIKYRFDDLLKLSTENANALDVAIINDLQAARNLCETEIFNVAEKFKCQVNQLSIVATLPEENTGLQDRIKKAADYFIEKIKMNLSGVLENIYFETDNKAVKKLLSESLEKFQKEVFIKKACLAGSANGFETISYLRKRSDAEVDFHPVVKHKEKKITVSKDTQHPALYTRLKQWRDEQARENNCAVYQVLTIKAITELSNKLPMSVPELKTIKGIGQAKVKRFGVEIMAMIIEYCEEHGVVPEPIDIPVKEKKVKINSKQVSYDLYRSGKNIVEIARGRNFSVATIEGHLAHYVGSGELEVTEFVSEKKLQKVLDFIAENPEKSMGEIKNSFEDVSYSEIMFILQHYKRMQEA
ncbi:MAG TPA: helix-turn-helix domain-containing protein [Bacteroidales bacterium]|nr:helix-turn-helix domain-containing protein [Bacteroidales bacterium]